MALCRYFLCLLLATSVRSQNDSTPLNVIQVAQNLGLNTFVQLLTENGVADEWASAGKLLTLFCIYERSNYTKLRHEVYSLKCSSEYTLSICLISYERGIRK